jgi:hypothetical protein
MSGADEGWGQTKSCQGNVNVNMDGIGSSMR